MGVQVRTVMNENNEPLFCLADVCKVLELQPSRVKDRLKENGVTSSNVIDSMGRKQLTTFVNESNLYRVIMRSDKPQAVAFQDWVCEEVLPSLRKNGEYKIPSTDSEKFQMEKEMMVVDFTAKLLNMNDDGKIKMMRKVCEMHSLPGTLLPTYTPKTEETQCLANLLDGRMSSRAFNNILLSLGYVRKVENQGKPFYNITEKGLPYGENMKNAYSPNDKTVCRWYASKFEELYSRVFEEMKQKSLFRPN